MLKPPFDHHDKPNLRKYYLAKRKENPVPPEIVEALLEKAYSRILPLAQNKIIAGYVAIQDEIDILPMLARLSNSGIECALPCIIDKERELFFRAWKPNDALTHGKFYRILEPTENAPMVMPDIIIIPFVAIDKKGNRIGYGKGYYDRTLEILKKLNKNLQVIAIAPTSQICEFELILKDYDQKVDIIISE